MNALACLLMTAVCVAAVPVVPEPSTDNNATSTSYAEGADRDDADMFLLEPEPALDGKAHHLEMGQCENRDELLHSETIVVNNDGSSRVTGDIRVTVEAPVNITCFKLLDKMGNSSGAVPTYRDGGLGHNYVVLGFNTAYGYGFQFLVEIYGHHLNFQ